MPGKYYAKHTLNHLVDNQQRINELNTNFKNLMISNAIQHLLSTNEDIEQKKQYLINLQHDNYRHGRKYKYECNLSDYEIKRIIRSIGDDKLYFLIFGTTIQEENKTNKIIIISLVIVIFIISLIIVLSQY